MFSFLPIGPLLGTPYDVLKKSAPLKHRYWSCTAIATKLCPSTKASWFRCGTATEEIYHARWRGPQRYLSGRQRPVF